MYLQQFGRLNHFSKSRGDDGNEYDIFSILPGLQYFAEQGYTSDFKIVEAKLRNSFKGICGGNIDDWVRSKFLNLDNSKYD
jgi:hypothetical protein